MIKMAEKEGYLVIIDEGMTELRGKDYFAFLKEYQKRAFKIMGGN